jgi:monomeric isocitrate dehydrogenase
MDSDQWQQLGAAVRAGELYIADETVAADCWRACETRLHDLQDLLKLVDQAYNVGGFGDFQMAHDLQAKYLSQAADVLASVREHITVVQHIQDAMAASFRQITGQDITNAAALGRIGE